LHLRLGDQIPLTVDLNTGRKVTVRYTVVGTLFATQRADEAYAPLSTLTAPAAIPPDDLLASTGYEVTLRAGVSADTFSQTLQQLTADRIGVKVYDLNPPPAVTEAVGIMTLLGIVLMVIAGVGMLNAMQLSTRERYHELGTLKAIGLTPAQMVRSVVEGAVALGALSLVVGIPLGLVLTYQGLQALVCQQPRWTAPLPDGYQLARSGAARAGDIGHRNIGRLSARQMGGTRRSGRCPALRIAAVSCFPRPAPRRRRTVAP
jgi:ABC-type lipoprotein release transport system permease subunit